MADAGTLHDAFIDELRDAYDAEKQLTKALPKLAKAATSRGAEGGLRDASRGDAWTRRTSRAGVREPRRESARQTLRRDRRDHRRRQVGLEEDFDDATMDACLIAAGQRAEHYEMAAYGTLVAWAQGHGPRRSRDSAPGDSRRGEGGGQEAQRRSRRAGINQEAADAAHPEEGDEDDEDEPAATSRTRRYGDSCREAPGTPLEAVRNLKALQQLLAGVVRHPPASPSLTTSALKSSTVESHRIAVMPALT